MVSERLEVLAGTVVLGYPRKRPLIEGSLLHYIKLRVLLHDYTREDKTPGLILMH